MSYNNVVPAWVYMPVQLQATVMSDSGYPFSLNGGFFTEQEAQDYIDSISYQVISYEIKTTQKVLDKP